MEPLTNINEHFFLVGHLRAIGIAYLLGQHQQPGSTEAIAMQKILAFLTANIPENSMTPNTERELLDTYELLNGAVKDLAIGLLQQKEK